MTWAMNKSVCKHLRLMKQPAKNGCGKEVQENFREDRRIEEVVVDVKRYW